MVFWAPHDLKSGKMPLLNNILMNLNESIELGNKNLHAEAEEKFLGVIIHKDLNFEAIGSRL